MTVQIDQEKKISWTQIDFQDKALTGLKKVRCHWHDILIVLCIGAFAAFMTYKGAQWVNPVVVERQSANAWFDGDMWRVFENITDRKSDHQRTKVHPLFSLIAFPPVFLMTKAWHLEPIVAISILMSCVAALWVGGLFILLRSIGCRRYEAMLFSGLASVSAASMFWFVVPETYALGSLSLLLGLSFVVVTQYRQLSWYWYAAASIVTLSVTITNWMTGILAILVNHRVKRSIQITFYTLGFGTLLWAVQKMVFPTAVFFLGDREDTNYLNKSFSGGPLQVLKSFICHTMVMPAINFDTEQNKVLHWPMMVTQPSLPGSASPWGLVAVGLWTALLGLGLWGFFTTKQQPKLRIVLGLTILGQLMLHSVYGTETFLYSLHFIPLLILLAAFSVLTRARLLALLLGVALLVTAGINNVQQFNQATAYIQNQAPQRYQVLGEMQKRPNDPWPRDAGHVVLATPGSREVDKSYHEPGGSFSPTVGSFGVSVWLTDAAGKLQLTSDSIPLTEVEQKLAWDDAQPVPSILTKTKYYQARWSAMGPQRWQLNFKAQADAAVKPMLVLRSVGPAGGPITALTWDGQRLLVNDRWVVTLSSAPQKVYLGEEGHAGWMTERSPITQWQGKGGWGYAQFELAHDRDWTLVIQDTQPPQAIAQLAVTTTRAILDLSLPDKQFADSLHAQTAHLLMGTVGKQTRPGEPTNYPLAWQRDGAYELVAVARAGQLQVAKELSIYFAENDFFGGFGAEADAPGLSLWALEEVASRLKQREYDQLIWPNVRRKADFILRMMTTTEPIYQTFSGPIVPKVKDNPELMLVAEPAQDGLIVGRMDGHRPLMFINAVSYRGLLDAASFADRVNQPADAQRWRDAAAKLQQAYAKAFKLPDSDNHPSYISGPADTQQWRDTVAEIQLSHAKAYGADYKLKLPELDNDRTYISGIWPSWIAVSDTKKKFYQALQDRWNKRRDDHGGFRELPLWTYFDVAEAHQWLLLDQPDRAWSTLRWFWNNQASPGLYTWWEGKDEENTFHRWEKVRGWVKPKHVTPHYWTAAEMLLLQLDMLAYTDPGKSQGKPTVIIGAGIPQQWLSQAMSVRGLILPSGKIDWSWDGKQMQVKLTGDPVNVRLGPAFPTDTALRVEYTKPADTVLEAGLN